MIIRCTQKLLAELKIRSIPEESENEPFWSWHANVFRIERRKCVLITNDATLFTMFIPALKKSDFNFFHRVIIFIGIGSSIPPKKNPFRAQAN
jgi:hypothetical protein